MSIRCRFAPSPTGNLHLGTVRAALFNWLYAKNKKGKVICRIEDTDLNRSDPVFEKSIFEGLEWLGLEMTESPYKGGEFGPYRQSEKLSRYQEVANLLLSQNKAYYCFVTPEELDQEKQAAKDQNKPYVYSGRDASLAPEDALEKIQKGEKAVLRFRMPKEKMIIKDLIRGEIEFDAALIGDFVMMKSDGSPAYNFAVVVDDMDMQISHVIRGEDHISNTPKQQALFHALEKKAPIFAHLPMILGPDRSKLSKRHGATNVIDYKAQGFLPEAMLNYLALLGWTPPNQKEVLNQAELIDLFDIGAVNKSNAIFDHDKLKWMNGQYIKKTNIEWLLTAISPHLSEDNQNALKRFTTDQQYKMISLIQDNILLLTQANEALSIFLKSPDQIRDDISEIKFKQDQKDALILILDTLKETGHWVEERIDHRLQVLIEEKGLSKGKVLKPLRMATTGQSSGPNLLTVLELIGHEEVFSRLQFVLEL